MLWLNNECNTKNCIVNLWSPKMYFKTRCKQRVSNVFFNFVEVKYVKMTFKYAITVINNEMLFANDIVYNKQFCESDYHNRILICKCY